MSRSFAASSIFPTLLRAPDGEAMVGNTASTAAETPVNPTGPIVPTEVKFFFKKTKLGEKRPTLNLMIPLLTDEGFLTAIGDDKVRAYVLSLANDAIIGAAREQINDDAAPVDKQEDLKTERMTLEFIANMPPAERRGGGIAKEVWEDFGKDYTEVMAASANKNAEQLGNAVAILTKRFAPVKTNKKVVAFMKEQLAMWFANTPNAEDFAEVYEFLTTKADSLLNANEEALLANL